MQIGGTQQPEGVEDWDVNRASGDKPPEVQPLRKAQEGREATPEVVDEEGVNQNPRGDNVMDVDIDVGVPSHDDAALNDEHEGQGAAQAPKLVEEPPTGEEP